jgi:outer membrane protein assembly factor BamB
MYKQQTTKMNPEAKEFTVLPSREIIIRDSNGLKLMGSSSYFLNQTNPFEYVLFKKRILTTDWQGNYSVIDALDKKVIENGSSKGFFRVSDKYLGTEFMADGKYNFGYLDDEFKLVSAWQMTKHSNANLLVQDTWIVLSSLDKIIGLRQGKGNPAWEFSFSELDHTKYAQFSGAYKNKAVITLDNGGILILDADNGRSLKYWNDTKLRLWLSQPAPGSPVFYGLNHASFIELDAENMRIVRQVDIREELSQLAGEPLFVSASRFYNGMIYFIAGPGHIGVFDVATAKVKWIKKMEFRTKNTILPTARENIQSYEKELYVLDSEGDLHIFELEQ